MAAYARAKEGTLVSMTDRKVKEQKANKLEEVKGELWGSGVTIDEASFLLQQKQRELDANLPPEFLKKAREEAEAEYKANA